MIYIIKTERGPVYSLLPVYYDHENNKHETEADGQWISPATNRVYRYSSRHYDPQKDTEVFNFGDRFTKR